MSTRHPLWDAVDEMEDDIYDVERFGDLLSHPSASPHMIEAETLHIMAVPLVALGTRLRAKFKVALQMGVDL